jgi:hypothetical protein
VHKETWVGLAVKLWVSISCVGAISSVKHTRLETPKQARDLIFFKGFTREQLDCLGEGGLFMSRTDNLFFLLEEKWTKQLSCLLESKARETHITT